eukprot:1141438-Pelagomonas_calceolata.AAC.5
MLLLCYIVCRLRPMLGCREVAWLTQSCRKKMAARSSTIGKSCRHMHPTGTLLKQEGWWSM